MPNLSLSFFDRFEAKLNGKNIHFPTDKTRALLAFLVVESNYPRRRSELTLMFWPEQTGKRASHNLSQTLLRLRQSLQIEKSQEQPFLFITRQEIQFNPHSNHQLDVSRFKAFIQAYRQHHHLHGVSCPTCIQWLEQAVKLYRGEFLNGFFVEDSNDFEEWRTVQQQELHTHAIEALTKLVENFEKRGQYKRMLDYAQKYVTLEPYSDWANLKLIEARAYCGYHSSALQQFENYQSVLEQKFNTSPSAKLTEFYKSLKRRQPIVPSINTPIPVAEVVSHSGEKVRHVTILVCKSQSSHYDAFDEELENCLSCEKHCENIFNQKSHQLPLEKGENLRLFSQTYLKLTFCCHFHKRRIENEIHIFGITLY